MGGEWVDLIFAYGAALNPNERERIDVVFLLCFFASADFLF